MISLLLISSINVIWGLSASTNFTDNPTTKRELLVDRTTFEPSWLPPSRKVVPLILAQDGFHYMWNVSLGSPAQYLSVVVDTGSSNLMVFNNSYCTNPPSGSPNHIPKPCFTPGKSTSYVNETTLEDDAFLLIIDGEDVYGKIVIGQDFLGATLNIIGAPAQEMVSQRVEVEVAYDFQVHDPTGYPMQSYLDADGNLGLGYNRLTRNGLSPFLTLLDDEWEVPYGLIFSLDFNKRGTPSSLYVGGIPEKYRSTLQWSIPLANESMGLDPRMDGDFHQLTVFDLSLCGYNLFENAESEFGVQFNDYGGIPAIVDTGASCLTLPYQFFDEVVSWLPVSCGFTDDGTPLTVATCRAEGNYEYFFSDGVVELDILPTISFRLTPDGDWLYLDISTLLYGRDGKQLCLRRGYGAASFGSMAIRSFIASMDMQTFQVAFANKLATNVSNIQCAVPVQCQGMQTHNSPLNICEDPPCSSYYFFTFDDHTKTCQLSVAFHVLAILTITAFIVVELGLNEVHRWLTQKTIRTIELS